MIGINMMFILLILGSHINNKTTETMNQILIIFFNFLLSSYSEDFLFLMKLFIIPITVNGNENMYVVPINCIALHPKPSYCVIKIFIEFPKFEKLLLIKFAENTDDNCSNLFDAILGMVNHKNLNSGKSNLLMITHSAIGIVITLIIKNDIIAVFNFISFFTVKYISAGITKNGKKKYEVPYA